MAAALGRKVSGAYGLLRPLLLFTRAPKVCQFSTIGQPQMIRKIASAPVWSTKLCQPPQQSILQRVLPYLPSLVHQPCRNLTYFSVKKGKRKSVKSVTERFLRLHCGLWVRRQAGYKKKLWKKLPARKKRLREFIFCNKTQCKLLDKMTTSFWKRRNWYLNDPYFKYHDRVNLKV